MIHLAGAPKKTITHQLYTGDCKHPEDKIDMGYGFAGASYGFRGLGIYAECEACGSVDYTPDEPTEDEKEWYKNNPVSKGWVTITRN